ncbi:MAG: preprotein translocase subunit SecE [Oscillospiraceae bacterium]|nr:preprotein translocase subunit SecE [Oscillospiraceae bacterium]
MANNDNEKTKKPFFKDFKAELKKVTWPTPKQIFNNTMSVITIVVITIIIVFILDMAFDAFNKYGVNKLKGVSDNSLIDNTVDENTIDGNTVDNTVDLNSIDLNSIDGNSIDVNMTNLVQ